MYHHLMNEFSSDRHLQVYEEVKSDDDNDKLWSSWDTDIHI